MDMVIGHRCELVMTGLRETGPGALDAARKGRGWEGRCVLEHLILKSILALTVIRGLCGRSDGSELIYPSTAKWLDRLDAGQQVSAV